MARHARWLVPVLALTACSVSTTFSAGDAGSGDPGGGPGGTPYSGGLIIDHRAVAGFDAIPVYWLGKAKELAIHYARTSHGSQIIDGALALEAAQPAYAFAVTSDGSTASLPAIESPAALRMYDGNAPLGTYITPDLYWDGDTGMNATRAVAATGRFGYSMWSWCGQQSSNDRATLQRYMDNLAALEAAYPGVRFIYMTGHTDGSDTPGVAGTLKYNNALVRQYVSDHDKVLFDFADIESYDPAGNRYPTASDACEWCAQWCTDHPADCTGLAGGCAHTHPFNCKIKAKAFWYMMARLAGWDGR